MIQLQWMIGIEIFYLGWFCLDKEGGKKYLEALAISASPIIQNSRVLALRIWRRIKLCLTNGDLNF